MEYTQQDGRRCSDDDLAEQWLRKRDGIGFQRGRPFAFYSQTCRQTLFILRLPMRMMLMILMKHMLMMLVMMMIWVTSGWVGMQVPVGCARGRQAG